MLTILIALAAGALAAFASGRALDNQSWGVLVGIAVMIAIQIGAGLFVRRRVNAVNAEIQALMTATQAKLSRKLNGFQQRPGMSPKVAQEILEKDQTAAVHEALALSHRLDKFFPWSFLLDRQINTMRMMFHYQVREFAEADKLMGKCLFFEPTASAMKLARMYKRNDPKLDKFARKKLKSAKGDSGAALYALYSWILVKRNDIAGAIKLLIDSKKRCDNPVLNDNWERLVNGKVKNFSNAALGDRWYMLYLEEPKVKTQKVRYQQM